MPEPMREAVFSITNAELEDLGILELVDTCRSAGLRDVEELECQGTGAILQVEVDRRLDEDRLDDLASVDWWERVRNADDSQEYIISFTATELSESIVDRSDDLVGNCDPEVTDHGASFSFVGPQEAIRETVAEYEDVGMSPDLRKIGSYNGSARPLDSLTDRQQEVVENAFDLGYYEVPREASTEVVASELDLDPSTVAEHLQRAERNLLREQLSTD